MKRTPMLLMLLLATALSDSQASGASSGTPNSPGEDADGSALQASDGDMSALEEVHHAAARRIKPAA